MKIILSRKGVDSSAGGFASPIFPDGQMISIPIPDDRSVVRYSDIKSSDKNRSVGKLVRELSGGKLKATTKAHVDPDLDCTQLARDSGWSPLFGQCGAAQTHLQSLNIDKGDLFLYFGWFRKVEQYRNRWRYIVGAPDLHCFYGWMQIGSVDSVENIKQSQKDAWMHYHPHCLADFRGNNVIYRASSDLSIPSLSHPDLTLPDLTLPGAGLFASYRDDICLTAQGCSRSRWRLPLWMNPEGRRSTLSYHGDFKRWQKGDDHVLLRSAARGQEFVLDLDDYPEGREWVGRLFV